MGDATRVPGRAWVVTTAGIAVNLCLGILYAWSIWKAELIAPAGVEPGTAMTGLNEGWNYLSNADATTAYSICGFVFALTMIPGGRLQDRYGPRVGATLAGVCLGAGCVLAGMMQSFLGLIVGFGILGGIGMGFGYAAATPAAVRWFGPHRRGVIVGLVVAGYGAAAVYISPLAQSLIDARGLTVSFVALGGLFAAVICVAAQFLRMPPPGYQAPGAPLCEKPRTVVAGNDFTAKQMIGTWQFFALVMLFFASAQSGLLVIANASLILKKPTAGIAFFASMPWLLAAYGGIINASGRVGTGFYSDTLGRVNAYTLNGILAAACLFITPTIIEMKSVPLLFVVIGIAYWQYGGTLSLMPALTADFYGSKNLGLNYGLVFFGWGIAFFVPLLAGQITDATGRDDLAFYISGGILTVGVIASRFLRRPTVDVAPSIEKH